jgi:5-(carboxyamino)imidazole ribonucleotide synthase
MVVSLKTLPHRVGIIGGGQLGQMLALAARQIGVQPVILAHRATDCALQVTNEYFLDDGTDALLEIFLKSIDSITIENEFFDLERYERILQKFPTKEFFPSIASLKLAQNKLDQKQFLKKNKIPTLDFFPVEKLNQLEEAYDQFIGQVVFKQAELGYDGRGTFIFVGKKDRSKFESLRDKPGKSFFGYAEPLTKFKKELAVVVARSSRGEIMAYPTIETFQKNGICHWALAPAGITPSQNKMAQGIAKDVIKKLKGVGVFAIEMFILKNGKVVVNEIAPRVHNSGHLTLNACLTNQFEQHLRAILGLPLGSGDLLRPAAMVNIIGVNETNLEPKMPVSVKDNVHQSGLWFHWYGKTGFAKDRKLGHINAVGNSVKEALSRAQGARKKILI